MGSDGTTFSALHLNEVLDAIVSGVTLADADGRIVFSNDAADRILGVSAATGSSSDEWSAFYGVFLPDGETPFPAADYPLALALAGESTRDITMFVRNDVIADGAYLEVSGEPLRDGDGRIVGAAVVFRDVTRLRKTHRQLEETVERLEEIQRKKDELSAFVVHDLKSPLTGIITTCDLLAMGDLGDQTHGDVMAIRAAAHRMNQMVVDLLDIQLSEEGALELDTAEVEVNQLFVEVAEATSSRLISTDQILAMVTTDPVVLYLDRALIARVLVNLIDNCAKYGPQGGTIQMDAVRNGDESVTLRVWDDGPGVPTELRDEIFDKWARIEREDGERSEGSRGLGLRFCKVVVEAHGGEIWVEDAEPAGARFCVRLPSVGTS